MSVYSQVVHKGLLKNFLRYMKRRCEFLDQLPFFNYNTGAGIYIKETASQTNTRQLGSTLMRTMLQEVSDFCDPGIKENWSLKPHQQVIVVCAFVSYLEVIIHSFS